MGDGLSASCHLAVWLSSVCVLCGLTLCSGGPSFFAGGEYGFSVSQDVAVLLLCLYGFNWYWKTLSICCTVSLVALTPHCRIALLLPCTLAIPPFSFLCGLRMDVTSDDKRAEKEAVVLSRLHANEQQRLSRTQELRARAESKRNPEENADAIHSSICERCDAIFEKLKRDCSTAQLANEASMIEQEAARAADFLPAQLARACADKAKSAKDAVRNAQPKRKFAFSSKPRAQQAHNAATTNVPIQPSTTTAAASADARYASSPALANRSGEAVYVSVCSSAHDAPHRPALTLERLHNCTVYLTSSVLGSLTVSELNNCHVVCTAIAGPLHIDTCCTCTFACGAHQVRMTDSRECRLFVHSASPPTLEGCSDVSFAPFLPRAFGTSSTIALLQRAELLNQPAGNAQAQTEGELLDRELHVPSVQDFSWVKSTQSPNWKVLERSKAEQHHPQLVPSGQCRSVTV